MTSADRIRVLRIIARANVGGPAVQVVTLAGALDSERFETLLLVGAVGDGEADYLELAAPDLDVVHVPGLGRDPNPAGDLRALHRITSEVTRFRPHIVHTHTAKAGVLGRSAVLSRRPSRRPSTVHTFHGHVLTGYFRPSVVRAITTTERFLARRTSRLVAEGSRVRDELLAARIGSPDQYVVVPPGIAIADPPEQAVARTTLGLPAEPPVIAFVARLAAIKRPDRFADVALAVARRHPDVHVLVAGDGDLMGELRQRLTSLGSAVHFVGFRPDVETVYAASDVVVLTSDNEGMPYSLVEAALAGRAVVATDVGSVREVVVDGVTGLVTQPDVSLLTDGVVRLLDDPEWRREMGRAAADRARVAFGVDRLVDDTATMYEGLYRGGAGLVGKGDTTS